MFLLCLHNENIFLPFLEQRDVSRMIWDEEGELKVMDALQDGCNREILGLLSNSEQLDAALQTLYDEGKIVWSLPDRNNVKIETDVQRHEFARLTKEQSSYWKGQALLFASRLVQSGEYLPERYSPLSQLPSIVCPERALTSAIRIGRRLLDMFGRT